MVPVPRNCRPTRRWCRAPQGRARHHNLPCEAAVRAAARDRRLPAQGADPVLQPGQLRRPRTPGSAPRQSKGADQGRDPVGPPGMRQRNGPGKRNGPGGVACPRALRCHPIAHAGTVKSAGQSSCRRVLPLNYRASERELHGPDLNRHPTTRPGPVDPAIGGEY